MNYLLLSLITLVGLLAISCTDNLDIKKDYDFTIKILPVPKKLKSGDIVPLEFTILREKIYKNATFSFRYFQSDGKGTLTSDNGEKFIVNRFYNLSNDDFKLLYQSKCNEVQTLDFVFVDSFGKELEYSLSFQNDSKN